MKDESEAHECNDFRFENFKLDHIFAKEVTGTWNGKYVALNKEDYNKMKPKETIPAEILKMLQLLSSGAALSASVLGDSYDSESREARGFNEINYIYEEVLTKLSKIKKLVKEVEDNYEVKN